MSAPNVRQRLTPNRPRRVVENDEFGEFVARILRAYSVRVARGDIEALAHLWRLQGELDEAIETAVEGLRAEGWSWAEIGRRLGMTKQSAHERWGAS